MKHIKMLISTFAISTLTVHSHPVHLRRICNTSGFSGRLKFGDTQIGVPAYTNFNIDRIYNVEDTTRPFGEIVITLPRDRSVHQSLSAQQTKDVEYFDLELDKDGRLRIITEYVNEKEEDDDNNEWIVLETNEAEECVLLLRKTPNIDAAQRHETITDQIKQLRAQNNMTQSMEDVLGIHALEKALDEYHNLNNTVISEDYEQ